MGRGDPDEFMDRQPIERRLGRGLDKRLADLSLAVHVWGLHLAFADAAVEDPAVYSASKETCDQIREHAEHREAELALDLVLACG